MESEAQILLTNINLYFHGRERVGNLEYIASSLLPILPSRTRTPVRPSVPRSPRIMTFWHFSDG